MMNLNICLDTNIYIAILHFCNLLKPNQYQNWKGVGASQPRSEKETSTMQYLKIKTNFIF